MSFYRVIITLLIMACAWACEKPDIQGPDTDFDIQPRFGDKHTIFHFDASRANDNKTDNFRLKVRWDIYDDGNWETDFSIIKSFAFKFPDNGFYNIRCEVMDVSGNSSSIVHQIQVSPVPRDSSFTDPRNGKEYKAVFLFDRWWMSQNLNFGTALTDGQFPTDNSITEKYMYPDPAYHDLFGAYYTWNEASNYKKDSINGICPEGWRLPKLDDIQRINEVLWFSSDFTNYLAPEKEFMIDLVLSGKYIVPVNTWDSRGSTGNFWLNHKQPFERFQSWTYYSPYKKGYYSVPYSLKMLSDYNPLDTRFSEWKDEWGPYSYENVALPVRCIKDHNAK